MTIERDERILFHEAGTLDAVTRWITSHDEGLAEWLKNIRSQYHPERANVPDDQRVGVILLKDKDTRGPARIGALDVGGATLEDVTQWSTWQDPEASTRGRVTEDEGNQGNGAKAYMFRMFTGRARILGVKDGIRNCKGFEGKRGTPERGTPGFMPTVAEGREVPVPSWSAELNAVLAPYGIDLKDLPDEVQTALKKRQAFTLVEGVEPTGLHRGQIDVDDLIRRIFFHEQSTLAIEQLAIFVAHNGIVNPRRLAPDPIEPYEGFEKPRIYEIPEELDLPSGGKISTLKDGKGRRGRLVLQTSHNNMRRAHKTLRPRWKLSYRTAHQMIGSKTISDLVPNTPGSDYVYGFLELEALAPDYVEHGRRHPKPGPLIDAVDMFATAKIRELAREINDRRRHDLDERALDEVHEENRKLDEFKNQYLPPGGAGEGGGLGNSTAGPPPSPSPPLRPSGTVPNEVVFGFSDDNFRLCRSMTLNMRQLLRLQVKDHLGRHVHGVNLEWQSSDDNIVRFTGDRMQARNKGTAEIWAKVKGTSVQSEKLEVHVWVADHILLTPRSLEIPLGSKQEVLAEVTNDDGFRATDVHLDWRHDAADPLTVRITPKGSVTGNRLGRTRITAGAGDPSAGGVWSRIPVEAVVVPNPEQPNRGSGSPQLLLTGRDIDPDTGEVRPGDPDSPALWQEVSDYQNNIWWLNLESSDAAFAFNQKAEHPHLWRTFHVLKLIEMVVQVHMEDEFTRRGEDERQEYWASHKQAIERHQVALTTDMWEKLEDYLQSGNVPE